MQLWCLRLACALLGPHASPMLHKRLSVTALLPILLARLKTYKVTSPSVLILLKSSFSAVVHGALPLADLCCCGNLMCQEDVVVAGVCMHVLAAMAQGGPSNRTELVQEVISTRNPHHWIEMSCVWLIVGPVCVCVYCVCRSVCCW